jgi:hypothetical protein
MRYINLFTDLVNAKSQDDLKNAIAKAGNSAGGFLRKKQDGFKLSIDAYPGLFAGIEYLLPNFDPSSNIGLTVPIGLDFSWCNDNFGFIFSFFDFGAVVSYRITGSSNGFPSDITFQQLISPGLFVKWSPIESSPVTFMLGGEFSPQLRSINTNSAQLNKTNSFKIGILATFDIPFFYIN